MWQDLSEDRSGETQLCFLYSQLENLAEMHSHETSTNCLCDPIGQLLEILSRPFKPSSNK
jgi:hypothetical protein